MYIDHMTSSGSLEQQYRMEQEAIYIWYFELFRENGVALNIPIVAEPSVLTDLKLIEHLTVMRRVYAKEFSW